MAPWMTLEEESGTSRQTTHPHNGYYAGDFSRSADRPQGRLRRDGEAPRMQVMVLVTGDRLMLW